MTNGDQLRTQSSCIICSKPLGARPPNLILQHRAEGISIYALCSSDDCWSKMGDNMKRFRR